MKKGLKVFGVITVCLIAAMAFAYAMGDKEPIVYSWHYKITVTVDTPEGEKSGSAVREARTEFQPRPELKDFPYHIEIKSRGEAVPVDLGKRGMLFALIDWDSYRELYNAFPYGGQMDGKSKFPRDDYYKKTLKSGMKAELRANFPRMVTFKDIKDPKSAEAVKADDLAETLGVGVKLKDITLEITDEPVTWEIGGFLPWLSDLKANLDGSNVTTGNSYANTLHVGHFKRGAK